MKATTILGSNSHGAAAAKREAQDLDRHAPKPAANHLSLNERVRHDERNLGRDIDAYHQMAAPGSPLRPLKPPARRS